MAERAEPPGEGWNLVSSTVISSSSPQSAAAAPAAPEVPSEPAVQPTAAAPVTSDGWQPLTAAPSYANPLAASAGTQAATPPPHPVAPANPYVLVGGKSLQAQILAWAKRSGWAIDWRTPDDWIVPNDKGFGTDFEVAVRDVFDQAGANGADVRVDVWQGNRSIVVDKTGAE